MKTRVLFVALAIVSAGTLCAQNKVNGCVIDRTDNSKLIGVNVTLSNDSGQVAGTTTDINGKFTLNAEKGDYILELSDNNGKFTLNAEKGDYILELSYIGYETIRMALTVNGDTHIGDILMQEGAMELGEVVVESQAVIQKVDRQILLPSKEQLQASSDGVSLLQNLQIPRIVISPIDNSVKTLSDESVQLRINGIEASTSDVKAINPKDIIRVEYHDIWQVRCILANRLYKQSPLMRRTIFIGRVPTMRPTIFRQAR